MEVQALGIGVIWPVNGGFGRQPSSARWRRIWTKVEGRRYEEEWRRDACELRCRGLTGVHVAVDCGGPASARDPQPRPRRAAHEVRRCSLQRELNLGAAPKVERQLWQCHELGALRQRKARAQS